jgi:hypothetical protein
MEACGALSEVDTSLSFLLTLESYLLGYWFSLLGFLFFSLVFLLTFLISFILGLVYLRIWATGFLRLLGFFGSHWYGLDTDTDGIKDTL